MSFISNAHLSKFSKMTSPRLQIQMSTNNMWSYTELKHSIDHNSISKAVINPSSITTLDTNGELHQTTIFTNQIESILSNFVSRNVDVSFSVQNSITTEIL